MDCFYVKEDKNEIKTRKFVQLIPRIQFMCLGAIDLWNLGKYIDLTWL